MQVNSVTQVKSSLGLQKSSLLKNSKDNYSGEDIIGYYYEFCNQYPDISFRIDDHSSYVPGKVAMGYNDSMYETKAGFGKSPEQVSIAIDISVLRKMCADKSYEDNIRGDVERIRRHWNDNFNPGYPYKCVSIEDTSGTIGTSYSQAPFSSEEEIKKIQREGEFSLNPKDLYIKTQTDMMKELLELGEVKREGAKSFAEKYKEYEAYNIYED